MKGTPRKDTISGDSSSCPILPRPQIARMLPGFFLMSRGTVLAAGSSTVCRRQAGQLAQSLKDLTRLSLCIGRPTGKCGRIVLRLVGKLANVANQDEGYTLSVRPDVIEIQAVAAVGLFHAQQSLLDLLKHEADQWRIPCCEIRDWPDFAWRGMMIDPARKFIPLDQVRRYIDLMARNKMNRLHLHLGDNEQLAVESKRFPALNKRCYHHLLHHSGPGRELFPEMRPYWLAKPYVLQDVQKLEDTHAGYYTQAEMKKLVAYAAERHVEIIPEIEMPGHANNLLRVFPELCCHVHNGHGSLGVPCLGNEQTYRIMEQLIDELAPLFTSKIFHIGADEVENTVHEAEGRLIHAQTWDKCEVCQARMKAEGLSDIRELYYSFIGHIHRHLAKHGKRLMMWNDEIDISRKRPVPKDVLIHFWRIATPGCGPVKGCSFKKFLDAGYEVINSSYTETYLDLFVNEIKLAKWHPARRTALSTALKHRIGGSELCLWGDCEHYRWTAPSAMVMFSDRLWHRQPISDMPEFSRSAARHLFGPHLPSALRDIYRWCGALIPALWTMENRRIHKHKDMPMPTQALKTEQACRKVIELIGREIRRGRIDNVELMGEYREAVQELTVQLSQAD